MCGTRFMRRPCEASRFCGHPCYVKSRTGIRPKEITRKCLRCGKLMRDYVSQIGTYCSKKCCDDDKRTDPAARLWNYVDVDDPSHCWLWVGTVGTDGYGKFWCNGKTTHAHRAAYEVTYGPIPDTDARLVCHNCDTPLCCNPLHLFLGTHKDNMDDMTAKGRRRSRPKQRVSKVCLVCGTTFSHTPYRAAKTSACSPKCAMVLAWKRRKGHPVTAIR
jgi:hypothetical protein